MYVEKTTSEERGIIGSKVEGLIVQFDTCQTLLQDIVENGFEFFRDEQHRKEFEDWYLKKYGKPYVWEPACWKR